MLMSVSQLLLLLPLMLVLLQPWMRLARHSGGRDGVQVVHGGEGLTSTLLRAVVEADR